MRSRPVPEKARLIAEVKENVWPHLETGRYAPVIDSIFSLDEAVKAHQRMEASAHFGKILLSLKYYPKNAHHIQRDSISL